MDELSQIKEKINIIDLVSEYVPLKKAGLNYKAPCPFHQEKTPSFVVSPERQIFKCFGCDKGGDIFRFYMEKEGVSFPEAIEILAERAGVKLQKKTRVEEDPKDNLFNINQKAAQFYQYLLLNHKIGKTSLSYLKKRGLTDETIKEFGLGYAPQNWETLTKFLKKRGFSTKIIVESGLGVASQKGCYDRFRGRIIFPLVDIRDRILGFSGRILDVGDPKYINTPQTPIFDKGKFLFGLHKTKGIIKEKKTVVLVEGEFDMLMSYQSGVKNVVASKGTALTESGIEVLKKYAETLILCFDTDLAGDAASRRGIEIADKAGLNLQVIVFGGVKDPAEVCLNNPEDWQKMVASAVPIYDYYLESVTKRFDLKLATSKKAIFAELLPIWAKISDQIVKEHYLEKLAALLQVKDDVVRNELKKVQRIESFPSRFNPVSKPTEAIPTDNILPKSRRELLEEYLISLVLHMPDEEIYVPNFPETLFTDELLKQIYVMLVLFLDAIAFKTKAFNISEFVKTLPEDLSEIVDRLYLMPIDERLEVVSNWKKEVDLVIGELKKMLIKSSLEKLSLQIKNAQEFGKIETLETLNRRFRDLSIKLKNL